MSTYSIERSSDTPIGAPVHNYWPAPPIRKLTKKEEAEQEKLLDLLFGVSLQRGMELTELPPESLVPLATILELTEAE